MSLLGWPSHDAITQDRGTHYDTDCDSASRPSPDQPWYKILNVQVLIATHSDRDALHETTVRPLQMGEALEPRVAAGFVSRAHALSGSMR